MSKKNENQSKSDANRSTSQPSRWRRSWSNIKENFFVGLLYTVIILPIAGPIVGGIIYVPCYRASLKGAEFTVDRRERIVKGSGEDTQSYYLVWSKEGEVFCVTDTWSFMRFDSSDRYGKLREGSHIKAKVAGWRVQFLSWYRNVVEIEEIDPAAQ